MKHINESYADGKLRCRIDYDEYLQELKRNTIAVFNGLDRQQLNSRSTAFREGYIDELGQLRWSHLCQGDEFTLS